MNYKKIKILLIEDSPTSAIRTRKMLEEKKGTLFESELKSVTSLAQGIEYLSKEVADVVLLDLVLPDSEGLDTFLSIKKNAPDSAIIVLTGSDDDVQAMKSIQKGAQDYLVKNQVDSTLLKRSIAYAAERKKSETALKNVRDELALWDAKLRLANNELKSFNFSVSHDLRAPLRSISGFSNVLLEDHSDQLDDEGMDALRRICKAAEQMGELINDLLGLSHVTLWEMHEEKIDLSRLSESICNELLIQYPNYKGKFNIEKGIHVTGDERLLKISLENLLGNALKFSSVNPDAQIDVGVEQQEARQVVFIRDNGAGFNMKYVDKLFKPFQRLHSQKEFVGTGVGLATVKRIIDRHGGEIWGESILGKGATFYFYLRK